MSQGKGPIVSVIIPAYNRERTLGRSIRSALQQTLDDLEVIVVDDGSTDHSRVLVEGFNDARVRYLRHADNRGAAAARNTGINAARGQYLAFLDSDDEWLPGKLRAQIGHLGDPPADGIVSCSGYVLVMNGTEFIYSHVTPSSWETHLHSVCDLSPGTTLVVHRSCVENVGNLDESFQVHEDWDWLLRLVMAYPLAIVARPLARVYRGALRPAELVEASTHRFLRKHEASFRVFGWCYHHRVISKHWLMLAYWFYRERQFPRGHLYLFKAFLHNPPRNGVVFLLGFCIATLDALLGTSLIVWARERRRNLLGR